jgi:hypothetical protein
MEPEDRFAALVAAVADRPGVTLPDESGGSRFGSSALKVNGSIFAMLRSGQLVVKLPGDRVADCIANGTGGPFTAGKGRPMKQWLTVIGDDQGTWLNLTREALEFVASARSV